MDTPWWKEAENVTGPLPLSGAVAWMTPGTALLERTHAAPPRPLEHNILYLLDLALVISEAQS